LCNTIQNVVGVWVFRDTDLISYTVKPGFPSPNASEQKKMFVQAQMMVSMALTNQEMYGKLNYVGTSFGNADCYLFPLEEKGAILAAACIRPYSIETITKAVSVMVVL
jgi:hypothetical protein